MTEVWNSGVDVYDGAIWYQLWYVYSEGGE